MTAVYFTTASSRARSPLAATQKAHRSAGPKSRRERLAEHDTHARQHIEPRPGLEVTAIAVIDDHRPDIVPGKHVVDTEETPEAHTPQVHGVAAGDAERGVR